MMKKYFLLVLVMVTSFTLYAAQEIPGTIVFHNETVDVTLLVPVGLFGGDPNTEAMQKGIKYRDSHGKKHKLKPAQAIEFSFTYEGKVWRMVSSDYTSGLFSKGIFLLQLVDGPVKMFEYTYTTRSAGGPNGVGGMTTTTTINLMQRGNEPLYALRLFGFKKDMAEYFKDCPALVALIEGKEFKKRDLMEIVHYYNYQCK
jgi:hypothetical protein